MNREEDGAVSFFVVFPNTNKKYLTYKIKNMETELKNKLMPLYEEMLSQFKDRSSMTTFCARWERDFPQEKGKGIQWRERQREDFQTQQSN